MLPFPYQSNKEMMTRLEQVQELVNKGITSKKEIAAQTGIHPSYLHRLMKEVEVKQIAADLNEKEMLVLDAVIEAHGWAGGDFTYADEVEDELEEKILKNQLKGYLSQLVHKGYIFVTDDQYRQINLRRKVEEIYPNIEDSCQVY